MSCGIAMRMMCDSYLMRSSCIGSPGLDGLRWLKPVRAGDALRMRSTVLEQTASSKVPTRGTVRFLLELINQDDAVVMTMEGRQLFTRRQAA
jgi:acyl dehydratase